MTSDPFATYQPDHMLANAFRMADDEFEDAVAGDMSIDVGDAAIGEELSKGATGAYSAPIRGRKQEDGAISATTAGTQARGGASSLSWHKSVSVVRVSFVFRYFRITRYSSSCQTWRATYIRNHGMSSAL